MDHDLSSRHNIMIRACLPKNDKKLMKMMLYEDDQEIDLGAVGKLNVSGGLGGKYQISTDFKFLNFSWHRNCVYLDTSFRWTEKKLSEAV